MHGSRDQLQTCYIPEVLSDNRVWGVSLQLYELRSTRNWGIGDFEDLGAMIELAGKWGADFIGLNPLHAPFLADPERCSPYEPSNRQMLNPLYIAVDKVPGFKSSPRLRGRLQALRSTDLVDYAAVATTKIEALWELFQSWLPQATDDPGSGHADFDAFVREGGVVLRRHALFETISFHMVREGYAAGWKTWPDDYQNVASRGVKLFAADHADDVRFHKWLQWLAHRQLSNAADAARQAGLRVGLYLDLAVGEAVDGSATWSEPHVYVVQATVGSPPDPFAPDGQDWHLAAIHPSMIASGRSAPYRRMVAAAMRYAGAVRIDHAAALRRLFLVPLNGKPDRGAYVDYPQGDLLQILEETSMRYRCLVIGEDLGLLPDGLQDDLSKACILSYRILSYEREHDGFKPAEVYPELALACISTHDHQTLAGWWRGADIKDRADHGIISPDVTVRHVEERRNEKRDLANVLDIAGVTQSTELLPQAATTTNVTELLVSAHRFIAKTPSLLAAARLADMTGEKNPTNIPGTSDSYPNWKPRLSVSVEELASVSLLQAITEVFRQERPTSVNQASQEKK